MLSAQAEDAHPRRLLFYNRSAGFEHSVVQVKDDKPCYAETILRPICEKQHWELVSTKDGDIFTPENIAKFDAFLFYTTGDLTGPATNKTDHSKPMSKEGKKAFLDAIHNGKGFVGFHCASDTFHSEGEKYETQPVDKRDPVHQHDRRRVHHARRAARCHDEGRRSSISRRVEARLKLHEEGRVVFAKEFRG